MKRTRQQIEFDANAAFWDKDNRRSLIKKINCCSAINLKSDDPRQLIICDMEKRLREITAGNGNQPKLTEDQIKEIKNSPTHYRNDYLAKLYNVSTGRISELRCEGK